MKRVLAWLLVIPLTAAAGLLVYSWWRERGFNGDHPAPGKLHKGAHAIEGLGAEPTVVFVHGNPGSCLDFAPVMTKLTPRLRTFAFDRPGYGWSPRPTALMTPTDQARFLHAAIKEMGLTRPVLVGFSFGGPVAIAYALEFPGEVSALVLVGAVGNPAAPHEMSEGQKKLLEPLGPLIAWGLGPLIGPDAVSSGYVEAFSPRPVDAETVERGRWLFTRPGSLLASARDWQVLDAELPRLAARYGELDLPIEVVSMREDRIVGETHADYLTGHLAGAHRADVEGVGHHVMATQPDALADAVLRAVARVH